MSRPRGLTRRAWVRVGLIGAIALLLGGRWAAIHHVERLWVDSLGALTTHQAIARMRLGLFALALTVAAVWCVGNLLLIYRSIGSVQVPRRLGNLEFVEAVPRRYLLWGTVGLGLATAWLLSHGARDWWDEFALLGANLSESLRDPILRRDVGYYLFVLPWQHVLQRFFLTLTGVVAVLTILLYGAVGALHWRARRLVVSEVARPHLAGVLAAFAISLFFGFRLDPAEYVAGLHGVPYDSVLVGVRLPVSRALAAFALLAAGASLAWIWLERLSLVGVSWAVLMVVAFAGRLVVPAFAAAMRPAERRVLPEVAAQQGRLLGVAYGLTPRDTMIQPPLVPDPSVLGSHAGEVSLTPVWEDYVLADLLNGVADRRPLDRFDGASLGLYSPAQGPAVPLFVADRRVDLAGALEAGRNLTWQDVHRGPYAHAVGAVGVLAHALSPAGLPLFLSRPEEPAGAGVTMRDLILQDSVLRFGPATGEFSVLTDSLQAPGSGIPAGSWLRRVALAWVLQSPRLLSREAVPHGSRILWRRSVVDRLDRVAPFARFDAPYAVVSGGRLHWLAVGYLRAAAFPLSILAPWRTERVRYLRAGLLGVVDAHSGAVAVFLLDPRDPLAAAWARLAPDIVRPADQVPAALRPHLRYPVELFRLQVSLLLRDTTSGLPVLPVRPPSTVRGAGAPDSDAARAAAPRWVIGSFPGETDPRLRLRAPVERGDPPMLAMVVDGVVRDGRPALEVIRLAPPLVHPAPLEVGAPAPVDAGVFPGLVRPLVFSDAVLTVRSVYAEASAAVPRLREVTVSAGPVVGRGSSLPEALTRVQAGLRSPASRGAQWAELREWFDRLERARAAGDWAAFGRAYDQLRRLLGVPRDTAP